TSLFFLAHPGYGANVGGTVAAGTAFGLAALLHARVRFSWAHALALGTVATALVATVAWWDGTRSLAVQSHLGKAVNLVRQEGWPAVQEIIGRKLATNLRLIRYTVWTRALLSGLAVLAVLLYYQVGKVGECCRSYPKLTRSLVAMVAGSFVALVFNDSGIVAAATMMIYGIGPFLTLILAYK
ncbi:MAG: hypothetical protein H5U00_06215, partial [Clostridia bacterium]|nr:hypothetical protein [Clostridia bacterium]